MRGVVLGSDHDFVGIGLNGIGLTGKLSGVAHYDVVGSFGESLLVETVLQDGALGLALY